MTRDTDGSPKGRDAQRLDGEAATAGAGTASHGGRHMTPTIPPVADDEAMRIASMIREPTFNGRGDSYYAPSFPGIHLCGICMGPEGTGDALGEQPYTALDIPARSDAEARVMWEAAKAEAALESRDGEDFLCDLGLTDGHVDDFSTNRQMVPRLVAAALSARASLQNGGTGDGQ